MTMTAELRYKQRKEFTTEKLQAYHNAPKYKVCDITWGEETESLKRCIIGTLRNGKQPSQRGQRRIHEEQALAIRERLLVEIPAEKFLKMGEMSYLPPFTNTTPIYKQATLS